MMKKVAIHQPNYLPWIGFFQKMALADVFVILDTVQFSKDSYTQRTKIRTKEGWMWLTIPIRRKYYPKSIKDVYLPEDDRWKRKHWTSIASNYSKSRYFKEYKEFFKDLYSSDFKRLQEFNEKGIFYLMDKFGINVEIFRASEMDLNDLKATDLIIEIIKIVEGDGYLSGMGGKRYLDEDKFKRDGIKLEYFKFELFEYPQRWNGFEPYMSAIDLLFNVGESSKKKNQD